MENRAPDTARRTFAPTYSSAPYDAATRDRAKWAFLASFIVSCFLFWWLRSLLVRFVMQVPDPVENGTIAISLLAVVLFIAGYWLPISGRGSQLLSCRMLDACAHFAYINTIILFIPSILIAIFQWWSGGNSTLSPPSPMFQAVLYVHLFFGFMYLGAVDSEKDGLRRIATLVGALTLPRLIISLHGGRFFLAQAIVPALFIAFARGWIQLTIKRTFQFLLIAVFIIFVPAITRGDVILGPANELSLFMGSNILGLFQDNLGVSLDDNCPPLLISLTAKTIPYGAMSVCVIDIGGRKAMPATLERILTKNEPGSFQGTASGTGSNYLLELYVTGGLFAVYAGSLILGFTSRQFVCWIGKRSLFAGIWAECLSRILLTPRGNFGYVYERIPSLVAATFLVILTVMAGHLLMRENSLPQAHRGALS